jgi:acetyltransferase-like isoleucine patch superfamily enzyme
LKPVNVPTTDVNSDRGILVAWRVENRSRVSQGAQVADVETSKALLEVESPADGFLLHAAALNDTVPLDSPIAFVFPDSAALEEYDENLRRSREAAAATGEGVRATQQARKRAEELGVDISRLDATRLITVKEVEAAAGRGTVANYSSMPPALRGRDGVQRVLLIGAALGATQVLDILDGAPNQQAVAIVDDDASTWGRDVFGVPVIGGTDRLASLHGEGAYDAAIITIGSSIPARVKLRRLCESRGIPLANAIDKSARLLKDVSIGHGNVIAAFCHIANGTVIGHNNFISAHSSFDHHNVLGSEITTGPACATSGLVRIGSRVKMGMGVLIEPKVEIGDDAVVASGAVIVKSVPAAHAVKVKIVTTAVVPVRPL